MAVPPAGEYFESVHHGSWWRSRGDQPFLYRTRLRYLHKWAPRGILLDVGAGEGHFTRRAAATGWPVIALEGRRDGAERTRTMHDRVIQGDGTRLGVRECSVAVVTLWDVVEHIPHPSAAFGEMARVLEPGGLLALSTPNPDALSVRRRGDASIQFSDPTHVSVLTIDDWVARLRLAGFEILLTGTDTWWDPPYHRGVPRLFWRGLSQVMFALRMAWPIKSGENTVIVARKCH